MPQAVGNETALGTLVAVVAGTGGLGGLILVKIELERLVFGRNCPGGIADFQRVAGRGFAHDRWTQLIQRVNAESLSLTDRGSQFQHLNGCRGFSAQGQFDGGRLAGWRGCFGIQPEINVLDFAAGGRVGTDPGQFDPVSSRCFRCRTGQPGFTGRGVRSGRGRQGIGTACGSRTGTFGEGTRVDGAEVNGGDA